MCVVAGPDKLVVQASNKSLKTDLKLLMTFILIALCLFKIKIDSFDGFLLAGDKVILE